MVVFVLLNKINVTVINENGLIYDYMEEMTCDRNFQSMNVDIHNHVDLLILNIIKIIIVYISRKKELYSFFII